MRIKGKQIEPGTIPRSAVDASFEHTLAQIITRTNQVSTTLPGAVSAPYVGTVRRYFTSPYTFVKVSLGMSASQPKDTVITVRKNGNAVNSLTIPAGEFFSVATVAIEIAAGDYLTTDVASGTATDLVVTFE